MKRRTGTRPRGAAIVMAMAVVALAALAASALLLTQGTWARQVELAAGHAQARRLVDAGIDWSRALLYDDRRAGQIDHAAEPWALRLPAVPVEGGELFGHLDDQQSRFNLNNLVGAGGVDALQLAALRRLLVAVQLPPGLADAVADWIDADAQAQGGAEDGWYLDLPSPHLAANRPLHDTAELARVRGFDAATRDRLRPFVSALPRPTAVNVNTAPAEVLVAVVPGLGLDAARALVEERRRAPFLDRTGFIDRLPAGATVAPQAISVASDWFLVEVRVELDGARARGSALLARDTPSWPRIVWRRAP